MYYASGNENERKREMNDLRIRLQNWLKLASDARDDGNDFIFRSAMRSAYLCRKDLARLIASVNSKNAHFYSWNGSI